MGKRQRCSGYAFTALVLYILSARSTPRGFTAALLNRHEAGEEIDARSIRAELMAIRAAQRKTSSLKTEIPLAELPRPQGEIVQPNMKAQVMLAKVVDILVSRLSPSEFDEVRNIMTNEFVLNDTDLAGDIATAFLVAEQSVESRCKVKYELPLQRLEHGTYQLS